MAHTELDLRERRAIEDMLNAKMPISKIAAEIGRHRSTVYREIKRNFFTDEELPYLNGNYGMVAQREAAKRRARRRKLIRLEALRAHVVDRLRISDPSHDAHELRELEARHRDGAAVVAGALCEQQARHLGHAGDPRDHARELRGVDGAGERPACLVEPAGQR